MSSFDRLQREVITTGLCTHCGTCVGLSDGAWQMVETAHGPLPQVVGQTAVTDSALLYEACPGKGVDYPQLYQDLFGQLPNGETAINWLLGQTKKVYVGYAGTSEVRLGGASGGVITQTLLYLLETGRIEGAVVVKMGQPKPYLAQAIIATTPAEVMACAQSVYQPVPVNVILPQMAAFNGRLAYVGLPDQVASLRILQKAGHVGANKVDYVLGPYVGTNMYLGAIESYLRSNGIKSLDQVAELKYREGEWPGNLYIRTQDGREFRAEKFYYNYLIPFYVTMGCRLAVDFTNELTDISVGDAWNPQYEALGQGFSVVVARTDKGVNLLSEMSAKGKVMLEETAVAEALNMHGHMLDFKKRGTFIRLKWRQRWGKPVPHFGYHPTQLPLSRQLVEVVISGLFMIGSTRLARKIVEWLPIGLIGPLFNNLRKSWKSLSKPTKRKGLAEIEFIRNDIPPHA